MQLHWHTINIVLYYIAIIIANSDSVVIDSRLVIPVKPGLLATY